ncbi:MAG: carbohydrate kinase, partial [Mesorhizobium sp.]
ARSPALRKILGAAIGADTRTSAREEAGAAGAAMIAAVCVGQYASMDECVGEWVTPLLGEAEPSDPALAAIYDRMTPSYMLAHQALRPVWRAMATSQEN